MALFRFGSVVFFHQQQPNPQLQVQQGSTFKPAAAVSATSSTDTSAAAADAARASAAAQEQLIGRISPFTADPLKKRQQSEGG